MISALLDRFNKWRTHFRFRVYSASGNNAYRLPVTVVMVVKARNKRTAYEFFREYTKDDGFMNPVFKRYSNEKGELISKMVQIGRGLTVEEEQAKIDYLVSLLD